jgi:hypothetical protein
MPPHATDERAAADDARPVLGRFYLMIVVNLVSTSDLINTSFGGITAPRSVDLVLSPMSNSAAIFVLVLFRV